MSPAFRRNALKGIPGYQRRAKMLGERDSRLHRDPQVRQEPEEQYGETVGLSPATGKLEVRLDPNGSLSSSTDGLNVQVPAASGTSIETTEAWQSRVQVATQDQWAPVEDVTVLDEVSDPPITSLSQLITFQDQINADLLQAIRTLERQNESLRRQVNQLIEDFE